MLVRFSPFIFGILIAAAPFVLFAQSADELKQQISTQQSAIDQLNKEIEQYEGQLKVVGAKKQSLQTTLSQIDLSIKKTNASISVTKNQIGTTQLQIQQLAGDISSAEAAIQTSERGIGESLRSLQETESQPMVMQILSESDLGDVWNDTESAMSLRLAIQTQIDALAQQKDTLSVSKSRTQEKKTQLEDQQKELQTQQGSLSATKKTQNDLLTQTKSQEATYQSIIAQKKAQEKSFEDALSDLQARLNVVINPSEIPPAGKGILHWPLAKIIVTQYFGNTEFAKSGAYNGKGHNGVDFGTPIGTPVKAALGGTIGGTGNTDAIRGCYSFGKWVMIKHANGLSTMYAHLSQINVTQGQSVATGEVIGYSGETGYATGPHLHFGVYLTSATQILKLGQATNSTTPCSNAVMPVAPLQGYLNPMEYL